MPESTEPHLDAPGAGLPGPELFIARRLFAWKRRFGSRESFSRRFEMERAAIRDLIAAIPEELRARRVLIPRLRGLEDSSRHWSAWMTLDHLRITNEAFAGIIATLAAGKTPPGKADTAAVKPSPGAGPEIEAAYEASCEDLVKVVAGIADLKTAPRFPHPWFGPLDAADWHALCATHLGIHRAQIAEIARRLPKS
jgi:hypothetical protein